MKCIISCIAALVVSQSCLAKSSSASRWHAPSGGDSFAHVARISDEGMTSGIACHSSVLLNVSRWERILVAMIIELEEDGVALDPVARISRWAETNYGVRLTRQAPEFGLYFAQVDIGGRTEVLVLGPAFEAASLRAVLSTLRGRTGGFLVLTQDASCTGGGSCTSEDPLCTSGQCTAGPAGTGCTSQTDCTTGGTCTAGGNPGGAFCTIGDACTAGHGCTQSDNCTDSFACTAGSFCTLGGEGQNCTAGNNCTTGADCTAISGCTSGDGGCTFGAKCTFSLACTASTQCTKGTGCTGSTTCTHGSYCTGDDGQAPGTGCTSGDWCTGGSSCTTGEDCTEGWWCTGGSQCTAGTNCTGVEDLAACTNGPAEVCTSGEKCSDGIGCPDPTGSSAAATLQRMLYGGGAFPWATASLIAFGLMPVPRRLSERA